MIDTQAASVSGCCLVHSWQKQFHEGRHSYREPHFPEVPEVEQKQLVEQLLTARHTINTLLSIRIFQIWNQIEEEHCTVPDKKY